FFFQAEDGIRDFHVTGVQTCALPILGEISTFYKGLLENQYAYEKLIIEAYFDNDYEKLLQALILNRTVIDTNKAKEVLKDLFERSEERRVGKECGYGWQENHQKQEKE